MTTQISKNILASITRKLEISVTCMESYPCQHSSKITLINGKTLSGFNSQYLAILIQNLNADQITYGTTGNKDAAWEHFKDYARVAKKNEPGFSSLVTVEELAAQILELARY